MDHNELEEPHDDFVVEITNLHQDDEGGSSNPPRFLTETWLLSPKYHKQKTIAAICIGLALLIVLFALTPVSQLFLRGSPPTVEPSTYYFGLDANPPWGSLSVDGKRVALFSRGAYTLFSLPRGQHTLTWRAAPFAPQQCRISVPVDFGSATCQFPDNAPDLAGIVSAYIRFPTDLSLLSSTQRTALLQRAQAMFDRQQSSETVQEGEVYAQTLAVSGTNARSCTIVLQSAALCFAAAQQPLKATLRLQLDTGSSPDALCANGACDSGNQGCQLFCDVPAFVGSNITLSPAVWQVSVLMQLLWQFATPDGRVVEENQADSFILGQQNALTVPLNITWNGMGWGVTSGSQSGSFGSDDPVCQAAIGDMYTLIFASTPPNTELQTVPGPTYTSGCLIKILLRSGLNGTPIPTPTASTVAYVIQRFGVLLAVNALAHRLWPFLPVADGYTQHIAQQLIT